MTYQAVGATGISTGPGGNYTLNYSVAGPVSCSVPTGGGDLTTNPAQLVLGPGTAACSGQIKATFTWNNVGNPSNVPPNQIIVKETSVARRFGNFKTHLLTTNFCR